MRRIGQESIDELRVLFFRGEPVIGAIEHRHGGGVEIIM